VVLGATTARLGVTPEEAAAIALYDLVGSPLWAAVRLLGLDPVGTAAVVARVAADFEPAVDDAAALAVDRIRSALPSMGSRGAGSSGPPVDLSWISWATAPLTDLAAEAHQQREERLFAS
jgi:urease accessory protein UreF